MAARRLAAEWAARLLLVVLVLGLPLAVVLSANLGSKGVIEVQAALPEAGGWIPGDLEATVGEPLRLRLVSTDVVHGFAIGQHDLSPVELYPGQSQELTLTFDRPGTYTYFCTRWCGVNHWRMRGTIEVTGPGREAVDIETPLYLELGIDLDRPRALETLPDQTPSASRGAALGIELPRQYAGWDTYTRNSPYELWQALIGEPAAQTLDEQEIWDLVAWAWGENTTTTGLANGQQLYAENCSACHGETGRGDGVMAGKLVETGQGLVGHNGSGHGHETVSPTDFTDSSSMLAASPALLQGKILRGGMGTGMPYWGPILTAHETWDLVAFLWTFQFED